jgi:hypothetical protein
MQLTRKGKEKGIEAVSGRIVVIKKRKGKKGKRKKGCVVVPRILISGIVWK